MLQIGVRVAINHGDIFGMENEVKSEIGVFGPLTPLFGGVGDRGKPAISWSPRLFGDGSRLPASPLDKSRRQERFDYAGGADGNPFESPALSKLSKSWGGDVVDFALMT
jgi:hypothetical protein